MKYFTKEWYSLPTDRTICMKPCEDRIYTQEEIDKLYQKKLKKAIKEEREAYDQPPYFVPIDFDELDLDDIVVIDEMTGKVERASSIQEAKKRFMEEQEEAMREFERRAPFNEKKVIAEFAECYEARKASCPEGLQPELFALDLLPKSIFDAWKKEDKKNEKIKEKAFKAYEKDPDVAILWDEYLHDGTIYSFENSELTLENCEEQLITLVFEDCEIVENEFQKGDWMLYEEVYRKGDRYEISFLTYGEEPHYITLRAKWVKIIK